MTAERWWADRADKTDDTHRRVRSSRPSRPADDPTAPPAYPYPRTNSPNSAVRTAGSRSARDNTA
jgi:hypothetical protein